MKKAVVGIWVWIMAGAGLAVAVDPDTVSREAWRVQVDTNANTLVTQYAAGKAGAMLAGKDGGTNTVWMAVQAGTNGWVKVAQGAQ